MRGAHENEERALQNTYLRAYKLTPKRPGELKATKTGLYIRSGKSFLCMDGCGLRAI